MGRYLLIITIALCTTSFGQTSEKYNSEYAEFFRAEELFEKEQYGAARKTFRIFIDELNRPNDPMQVKARFYEAISALELFNNDAIGLLEDFNYDYPESIYKKEVYFRLGKFYYYKQNYKDALVWFNKLSIQDVEPEDQEEFYFKLGYSYFKEEDYNAARDAFYEVKDGVTQYANPALYYYSHIAYQNEQYQMALDGFLKLENDEKFGKVVPYYIAQIYYLQGKYELVTEYATRAAVDGKIVNEKDLNHLIGDAYYRTGKYAEAVPYLEKYNHVANTDREEDYRLGYAYYRTGNCDKAIRMFDRVKKVKDSLGQVAYYHIGECLLKDDNKVSARSAFEEAAFIENGDPVVQEDALYNYAILSYKLDINPYDEAVEAFEMYLKMYPNSDRRDDVYSYLVHVYTSTNNYEKALSSLDKIPNKDIKLKMAYQLVAFNQGVDHYQKSNFPGAITSFELVNKYPVDPMLTGKAVYWKADANFRLRKFDEAIAGYKQFKSLPSTLSPELKYEAEYSIGYCHVEKAQVMQQAVYDAEGEAQIKRAKDKARPFHDNVISSFGTYVQSNPPNNHKKADAYMRIADANFLISNNSEAIRNYENAINLNAGYEDQASYYLAKTLGYSGHTSEKITRLLNIINNFKDSKYLKRSIYEVAESYKSQAQLSQAKQYYEQIINNYPESDLVMNSKINVAFILSKEGKYAQAEAGYKDVMAIYGADQTVCSTVAEGLKDMYIDMNQPEKVEELARLYPCFKFDPSEQENLYYIPAMDAYYDSTLSQRQRYEAAIPKFEKYLNKFPNGRYANDVNFYIANCHFELNNVQVAVNIYMKLLENPSNNANMELAAGRVAQYLYNSGRYEEVIKYYRRLETSSSNPQTIFNAKLGLMRSHFQVENWASASDYADKVLGSGQVSNDHKLEGYYAKGMANYHLNDFNKAKPALDWIINNVTKERAAEARFSLADLYYKRGDHQLALDEVTLLLKMKPAYNYWIAKGLILRTRVYMAQDKLFDAEQTLKSVREHYENQTDGIMDEANSLWDELMQLKNKPKNISPDTNPIIDINGGQ